MACPRAKCSRGLYNWTRKNKLLLATIAGVVLGVSLGIGMRELKLSLLNIKYFSFPGELFLRMLNMLIVPLVICSLISGASTIEGKSSGKIGLRTIIYFLISSFIAAILGVLLTVTINPGRFETKIVGNLVGNPRQVEPVDSLLDLIRNALPENIIGATFQQASSFRVPIVRNVTKTRMDNTTNSPTFNSTNQTYNVEETEQFEADYKIVVQKESGVNVLGLIVFSLTFGLIIGRMGHEGKLLVDFFVCADEAIMRMALIIIWYSPIGTFFLIASRIMEMENPEEILSQLGLYLLTVISGFTIHSFVVLPCAYLIVLRKNPFRFMVGVTQAIIVSLATSSSSASLPITMTCLKEKNGIDKRIVRLLMPIATTISMNGDAIYHAVAAIFIAQITGTHLSFGDLAVVSVTATAASIATPSVPQSLFVTLGMVLSAIGLPDNNIGFIVAVDWLLDRFSTAVNVWGSCVAAGVVEHLSKKEIVNHDIEQPPDGVTATQEVREDNGTLNASHYAETKTE